MEKIKDYSNNCVTHKRQGTVEYLTFNALEKYNKNIQCVVTLRHGGVSEGVYSSLNFRIAGEDKKENVLKNLDIICKTLNISINDVVKGSQSHTDNIIAITEENKVEYEFSKINSEEVDGYIVKDKNIATLVTTADCNAIVIYDPVNNVVANLHSGWKGTTKRIYLKALDIMKNEYDTKASNVIVCVSPSVLSCCFSSTDPNFKKIFTDIWNYPEEYITQDSKEKDRFHIDLPYVIQRDLLEKGVLKENIHFANICTCYNDKDFFSYRAKTQKGESDYGCMATIVRLI